MGHELRTPLNAIIGFSDIVGKGLAGPVTEEQERQLGMIRDAGRQLLTLVNDMLELARLQSGALVMNISTFDVIGTVHESVQSVTVIAQSKGVDVEVDVPDETLEVTSDAEKLRRVMECLVAAAVSQAHECTLSVALTSSGASLEFHVDGLSSCARPEQWIRLFPESAASESEVPSDGIELSLCLARAYAGALGGAIAIKPGGGGSLDSLVFTIPCEFSGPEEARSTNA
jgi:K+-sensing histidine kinase KdpD